MTLTEKITLLSHPAVAKAWRETSEKFLFCIDLLEISASHRLADHAVDLLEARFEALLKD